MLSFSLKVDARLRELVEKEYSDLPLYIVSDRSRRRFIRSIISTECTSDAQESSATRRYA